MRMRFLLALCFIPSVIGCSSSNYLVDKPLVLNPQGALVKADDLIQTRSMKALLDSFADYRWEIHKVDKEQHLITAEACRRGEHCAEVQATVKEDGSIEIIRTPGQDLSDDEGALLQGWLARLRKAYQKHMKASS